MRSTSKASDCLYLYKRVDYYRKFHQVNILIASLRLACIYATCKRTRQWRLYRSNYSIRIRHRFQFPTVLDIYQLNQNISSLTMTLMFSKKALQLLGFFGHVKNVFFLGISSFSHSHPSLPCPSTFLFTNFFDCYYIMKFFFRD